MRRRFVAKLLRERLATAPAAALFGPRQCGKTTLARTLGGSYFDAEQPAERARIDLLWDELMGSPKRIVIDEAHSFPELFPRIRGAIDHDRSRMGRFVLLGSVSPVLMREVSDSLAGRLSVVELSGFLLPELPAQSMARLWLQGGFPAGGVLGGRGFPAWQLDYVALLTQRDLPAWGFPARPQVSGRLMAMLAAQQGQVWNASRLGQSLGLTYHTVNSYLDYLEGAYLIRRLLPYSANIGKRLVKSPKVYLRDSGLLHGLLGIGDRDALLRHPHVGASFEGFVVEQVLSYLRASGVHATASFFRTSDGHEIDLLLEIGAQKIAIEVKLARDASREDMARLNHAATLVGAAHRYVVCQTRQPAMARDSGVTHVRGLLERLDVIAAGRRA